MVVLNRKQFRKHWENLIGDCSDNSPLWIPEQSTGKKSRWFVSKRPLKPEWYTEYRLWCQQYCSGQILCYSSSDKEEWWGFSHHADIMWWRLMWS